MQLVTSRGASEPDAAPSEDLALVEQELAVLPDLIEGAVNAGDEENLSRLRAREEILIRRRKNLKVAVVQAKLDAHNVGEVEASSALAAAGDEIARVSAAKVEVWRAEQNAILRFRGAESALGVFMQKRQRLEAEIRRIDASSDGGYAEGWGRDR
jgi:hypothetical protein